MTPLFSLPRVVVVLGSNFLEFFFIRSVKEALLSSAQKYPIVRGRATGLCILKLREYSRGMVRGGWIRRGETRRVFFVELVVVDQMGSRRGSGVNGNRALVGF